MCGIFQSKFMTQVRLSNPTTKCLNEHLLIMKPVINLQQIPPGGRIIPPKSVETEGAGVYCDIEKYKIYSINI